MALFLFWLLLSSIFSLFLIYYFSLLVYECHCMFLTECCFITSLGVLSFLLCGLWSLSATVGAGPEPQKWETRVQDIGSPENSQNHEILIGESPIEGLHLKTKIKLFPKSCKFPMLDTSYQTSRKTNLLKCRKAVKSYIKAIDSPKHIIGSGTTFQKFKTQIPSPEHRQKSPSYETFTRHWTNSTHRARFHS